MASSGCWTVVKTIADRWAPTRWRVQLHTVKLASILGGNFRLGSSRRRGGVAPDDQWRIFPECVHQDQSDDLAVRTESKPCTPQNGVVVRLKPDRDTQVAEIHHEALA